MSATLTPTRDLSTAPNTPGSTPATVEIEYWTVAMDSASCGACDDTLAAFRSAQQLLSDITEQLGLRIDVVTRSINSWDEAVEHSIAASPTIRSEGLELRPQHDGLSEARSWQWRGETSTGPRQGQLIEFLLAAVAARGRRVEEYRGAGGPAPYVAQFLQASASPAPDPKAAEVTEPADSCCG